MSDARPSGGQGETPWEPPPASSPAVHTPGTLIRVPNQPKTKIRGFRIPDELYQAAQARAADEGEDLSKVVRAALERYVKKRPKTHG